ncbi:MAG: diguanylate cyclase (GGDEF)-like protein [Flavobacteriales bacterium]|jgi:diguanylate cyclase (GGDEF)-like protein
MIVKKTLKMRSFFSINKFLLFCLLSYLVSAFSVYAQKKTINDLNVDTSGFPIVTYCIDPDWLPYEAIRNKQHVGMSADYMRYIGMLAEVNFVLVRTDSWEDSLVYFKSGQCDVVSMLNRSPERDKYMLFTQPYFNGTNVIVSRDNNEFIQGYENIAKQKLGAVASYRQAEYITSYYPQIDLQLVNNESNGLQLLAEGKIDLFVGSLLSMNAKIQKNGYNHLHISGIAEPQDLLSMGVSKRNQALLKKLDTAITKVPEWLHVEIYKEWNNVRVLDDIDYRLIWGVLTLFMLASTLGFWRQRIVGKFNRQLMVKNEQLELLQKELVKKNQSLEFLSIRDPLTAMFNRHFMTQRCEQERQLSLKTNQAVCLIVLDIDFFKPVNDNHGHSAGDTVLKEIAVRIANTIREIDISARWGGEEFLVLCPNTNKYEAVLLAKRLKNAMSQHTFGEVGHLTCSMGVAEFKADESFIQWFDRGDQALYQAKNNGRNKVVCA